MSTLDPRTHRDFYRILEWASWCDEGHCRYADPAKPARAPHPDQCPGYVGRIHVEDAALVARWRICDRHVTHTRAEGERSRIKAERESQVHGTRAAGRTTRPKAWSDDEDAA